VLRGINKRFRKVHAVRDLDLELKRGRIYGLLGPNGSGKTTTMRMVLSILLPDSGELRVLGKRSASESKSRIGYLPEDRGLYKRMRVRAFLSYMARLRGVPAKGLRTRIGEWLERVHLSDKLEARCGDLSRGQQQRVQTIAALIHEPDLLILDEPFSGLDPVNRRHLARLFDEQHARGCTLVFSTHMMQHAEEICEHLIMMNHGVKVLDAPLEDARTLDGSTHLICEPKVPLADLAPVMAIGGVISVQREGTALRVTLDPRVEPTEMLATLARALPMTRVEIERLTLEEIFVRTLEREERAS